LVRERSRVQISPAAPFFFYIVRFYALKSLRLDFAFLQNEKSEFKKSQIFRTACNSAVSRCCYPHKSSRYALALINANPSIIQRPCEIFELCRRLKYHRMEIKFHRAQLYPDCLNGTVSQIQRATILPNFILGLVYIWRRSCDVSVVLGAYWGSFPTSVFAEPGKRICLPSALARALVRVSTDFHFIGVSGGENGSGSHRSGCSRSCNRQVY